MAHRPPSGRNERPILTIVNTKEYTIRVWTRHSCDCGHICEALDVNMDGPHLVEVVCPACHKDVVLISRLER
jgi:hypothetical protein